VCYNQDNDCDGKVDNGYDLDGDGTTTCAGDCDDHNPAVHAGAAELFNTVDDNCDGKVDNQIAGKDFDKDGFVLEKDCDDEESLVGPGAIEVAGDQVDNNCDGAVDESLAPCDPSLTGTTAADFGKAMGFCPTARPEATWVQSVSFPTDVGASSSLLSKLQGARRIRTRYGTHYTPKEGTSFILLSTGRAKDGTEDDGLFSTYAPQQGVDLGTSTANPWYFYKAGCGTQLTPSQQTANDLIELKVTLKVPQNAQSFSVDSNFFSSEYPEYICRGFNDQFVLELQSEKFKGRINFDKKNNPISIDSAFFDVCQSIGTNVCSQPVSQLKDTGYDKTSGGIPMGGATGWLSTQAPVTPGETITLRFLIFDEKDNIYDSAVLLDNFKWQVKAVAAPTTDPVLN
jgi:hypothetical protein